MRVMSDPETPAAPADDRTALLHRRLLFAVLAVSLALRWYLVFAGGQNYFPDEVRYEKSRIAAQALCRSDIGAAAIALDSADHFLFKVIGVLPALCEQLVGANDKVPALFFSLFSVASVWLVWAIVLRTGASSRVALLSATLLALCSTLAYYARHLLPYDMSLAFGLFALYVGLHRPTRVADSMACGLSAACTFLTYNGYWTLAGFAMAFHALRVLPDRGRCATRLAVAGFSFAAPIAALLGASMLSGSDILHQYLHFSQTVIQGDFAEGWSLPLAYLWHAEHGLVALWAAGLICGLWKFARGNRAELLLLALAGVLTMYGTLVLFSVGMNKFAVYGRLVRQAVPFCSMLAAMFLDRLFASPRARPVAIVVLALAAIQAAVNLSPPLTQVFPREFERLAAEAAATQTEECEVHYAYYIWPAPVPATDTGRRIVERRHPAQYLPYQYEGYTPDQRRRLRTTDIRMRLVVKPPAVMPEQ